MSESKTKKTKGMALLFDATRCGGCRACVKACMKSHDFPGDPETVRELSATAYTVVHELGDDLNVRDMCRHCVTPSCASVCPVGALEKRELGPVTYDASKCMGCRYCMMACPFNVPKYEWNDAVPAVRKCDMCYDRQLRGEIPACAEACPNEATVFGTREELLAEAHKRIAEDPDEYHPHVYGEHEVGGTSVLFLSPVPVEALGFKASLGTEPLPDLTWNVLKKLPTVGVVGGSMLAAFWWITWRRDEVARVEGRKASTSGLFGKESPNGRA
jgi:formate dehydrogenase iron-sulfur subunit